MNRRQLSQRCHIEAVASLDNLFLAADKARRGKTRRADVEAWWMNHEAEIAALREELLGGSYQPGAYRFFELFRTKASLAQMSASIFAWYQFSREGNTEGLRRAYASWPLAPRLKRRRGRTPRVLRGASWNNNDRGNLRSSNRNHNTPGNRNNNNGFRCVVGMSAPKAAEAS